MIRQLNTILLPSLVLLLTGITVISAAPLSPAHVARYSDADVQPVIYDNVAIGPVAPLPALTSWEKFGRYIHKNIYNGNITKVAIGTGIATALCLAPRAPQATLGATILHTSANVLGFSALCALAFNFTAFNISELLD